MRPTVLGSDVVDKGEDVIRKAVVILKRHLHLKLLLITLDKDNGR